MTPDSSRRPLHGPVQDTMFRALAVLRLVLLVNTTVLYLVRFDRYDHPGAGGAVLALLAAWTWAVTWAYADPRRRGLPWLVADLAVALAAILLSPYVKGPGLHATVPGFFVMAAVLAWAIARRWPGGLLAAVAVSAADLSIRSVLTQKTYGNVFLLLLGGAIVGFLSELLQRTAGQRDEAERAAAAAAERARLARVVHDGVLQVLALVQRRGPELGPDGAALARLAGEQETRLRALVHQDAAPAVPTGEADLREPLGALQSRTVHVSLPATPVTMPAAVATEVVAVVEECLLNVRHHVGPDAEAWVLLEDLHDVWVVSVRDAGPGIPAGRVEEAAAEGRLGIAASIQGRMRDLGGTASLRTSAGQGTEWELAVPR